MKMQFLWQQHNSMIEEVGNEGILKQSFYLLFKLS